jgi:hypothetical protein
VFVNYAQRGFDRSAFDLTLNSQTNQDCEVTKFKVRIGNFRFTLDRDDISGNVPPFRLDARTSSSSSISIASALRRYDREMWKDALKWERGKFWIEVQLGDTSHARPPRGRRQIIDLSALGMPAHPQKGDE